MSYTVYIENNSDQENAKYKFDDFDTYEKAVTACKKIVDEFLIQNKTKRINKEELFRLWTLFGEDPFIIPKGEPLFSSSDYARMKCEYLCEKD